MDDYGYRTRTTAHINRLKPYYSRTAETQAMGEEDDVTLISRPHKLRDDQVLYAKIFSQVAKTDDKLAISLIKKQIDLDIRSFLPEHANETFAMFEQRLRSQHYNLQGKSAKSKPTFTANDSDAMDLGAIATGYRHTPNYTQSTSGYTRSRSHSLFKQRNPYPHTPENSTMPRAQFQEYIKRKCCFHCGEKGHIKLCVTS
ncbi:hypothetical protein BB560_006848 [Smittium megazygosporum]|uniref:Uncharacterized protein n=1 Tax=Smittium megazygosporum TaxID=133381 RepID=A0A2T9Y0X9_9FUNG|nr:hypothetical protein BB560_006848 [Smittium megazygosporum]